MARSGRSRQGAGQVMVTHSLSGALLSEGYCRGWECWQRALPTLVVLTKGKRLLTQNLPKGSALALPAQGKERQGGRKEKHLFPRLPARPWGNLALVSDAFPSTAPGTVNFSCSLSLTQTQTDVLL